VELVEVRTRNIPVETPRLRVKDEFVAQQGVQDRDDPAPLLVVQTDIDAHVFLLAAPRRPGLACNRRLQ
jgi:hypothetical protein